MAEPVGDPLGAVQPNRTLRESSVERAVKFLSDESVKSMEQGKALEFLRRKGFSEEELREACRVVGQPFPPAPSSGAPPPMPASHSFGHPPTAYPYGSSYPVPALRHANYPAPSPPRSSWVSVFLGITAAAGLYTAVREVLKRYVVPLYFPDAARIAEERRRREEHASDVHDKQIAELRSCVQELLESSQKTNEKVENISRSMSSTMALREREISQTSELRDAIRQLSHSVTASGGTETPREMNSHQTEMQRDVDHLNTATGSVGNKLGNLAYSYVNRFDGNTGEGKDESQGEIFRTPLTTLKDGASPEESGKVSGNNMVGRSVARIVSSLERKEGRHDDNDFMAIAPAEVDESWVPKNATRREPCEDIEEPAKVDNVEATSTPEAPEEPKEHIAPSGDIAEVVVVGDVATETFAGTGVDENQSDLNIGKEDASTAVARQLFQTAMMKEAQHVLAQVSDSGSSSRRRSRPLSMPSMDLPLSDSEY